MAAKLSELDLEGGSKVLPPALAGMLLDESPDSEAWLDAQGRVCWINGGGERLSGLPAPACLSMEHYPRPLVLGDDQALFDAVQTAAERRRGAGQAHVRVLRQDGSSVWVSLSWQPVFGEGGRRLGTRVSMRDTSLVERHASSPRDQLLSLRRHAVRITREARRHGPDLVALCNDLTRQTAQTLNVAQVGTWLFTAQRDRLSCVSLFKTALGHHTDGGSIAVADYPVYMAAISTDELVVAEDARAHPMTAELTPSYLEPLGLASMLDAPIVQDGRTVGVLCIEHGPGRRQWSAGEAAFADALAEFLGLHMQAQERERLQTLSLRLASIIETTPDLVYTATLQGDIVYLNGAGRRLLGLGPDESLEGLNAMDFATPEQQRVGREVIVPHALAHGSWSGEVVALTRDGQSFAAWESLLAHRGADGRVEYFSAVVRDLREQKRNENALRERESELQRLNDELERRVVERTRTIEEINRNLETFAFSVSHDLKAPLRGIDGYSRLLIEDFGAKLPPGARVFVDNIQQAAGNMTQLIDDLLAYSRVGRRELSASRFDLRTAVQRVLGERSHELQRLGVQVIDQLEDMQLTVDLECFLQIVRNLVDNAVKFTRRVEHPTIILSTRRQGEHLLFSVKDNGCGFDMKYHERIFSIFQRLHRAKDYPGTGVGLAIVAKAAERLGGRVWAQSEPGHGAEFFLELSLTGPPAGSKG